VVGPRPARDMPENIRGSRSGRTPVLAGLAQPPLSLALMIGLGRSGARGSAVLDWKQREERGGFCSSGRSGDAPWRGATGAAAAATDKTDDMAASHLRGLHHTPASAASVRDATRHGRSKWWWHAARFSACVFCVANWQASSACGACLFLSDVHI
jgi:hypothetical protein